MVYISAEDKQTLDTDLTNFILDEVTKSESPNAPKVLEELTQITQNPDNVEGVFSSENTTFTDQVRGLYNVIHTVTSYSPILLNRQYQAETAEEEKKLKTAIYAMKEHGYSCSEVIQFLQEIKIAKSGTSHPTETLNKEAIALVRRMVRAADSQQPQDEIKDVIRQLLAMDSIAAHGKQTITDEIDSTIEDSKIHTKGVYELTKRLQNILRETYHPLSAKDEKDIDNLRLNVGRRSWDFDSDGKNNAEGFAMMAKMATTTLHALQELETGLSQVQENNPTLFDEDQQKHLEQVRTAIRNLSPIYDASREIATTLASQAPEEREEYYREVYSNEYTKLKEQFRNIYAHADKNEGWDFYTSLIKELSDLKTQCIDTGADEAAAETVNRLRFNLRLNGIAMEKGQPRQNGIVQASIMNNLFQYEPFQALNIISPEEIDGINKVKKFDDLDTDTQYELMRKVEKYAETDEASENKLRQMLFDANPLTFSANGYPNQELTLLDRYELQSFFPFKFDHNIISDADKIAAYRQKVIASIFGMGNKMKNMPLHEDRLNLARQHELLRGIYERAAAPRYQKVREYTNANVEFAEFMGGRGVHETFIMRPCSDAERGGGSGTRQEAVDMFRKIVKLSLKLANEKNKGIPVEILLGCGISMHRYGGDPEIIRSVVEQELKAYAIERREEGNPLNPREDMDRRTLRSALGILWTEQGRGKRIMTASSGQITDDFSAYITRMIEGRLDIEDAFDNDYNFIAKPHWSDEDRDRFAKYYETAIKNYETMRFMQGQGEPLVIDSLSADVTCPIMCKYMNNASRPGAKAIGADERTKKRAIENNQRDLVSQIHLGRYGMGEMMDKIRLDHKDGILNKDDVQSILDNPEWEYNLFNKDVADAIRTDYTYAMRKIGLENITFEKLIHLGNTTSYSKSNPEEPFTLNWDGNYTEEQAYLARAYYDHVKYIAVLEAALDDRMDQSLEEMIEHIKPSKGINVAPGPKTIERYPAAVEIAKQSEKNLPGIKIVQELEDKMQTMIDDGMSQEDAVNAVGGEKYLRHIASAFRSGTLPHWEYWSGQERCLEHNQNPEITLESYVTAKPPSSEIEVTIAT